MAVDSQSVTGMPPNALFRFEQRENQGVGTINRLRELVERLHVAPRFHTPVFTPKCFPGSKRDFIFRGGGGGLERVP